MDIESRKKHIKKQNAISAAILIVGTVLSFFIFGPHGLKSEDESSVAAENLQPGVVSVVSVIELGKDETKVAQLEKTATLEPQGNGADVVTEYSGRIQSVDFEVGSYVREGQILAIFDQGNKQNSPKVSLESAQNSLQLALDNLERTKEIADESEELAESAVEIAEIQLKQAKDGDDKRAEDLAEENLDIAEDQEDQTKQSSELQINSARLQVEQARGAADQAKIAYEKTIVKAPISGLIVSKNINKDDYLNPGKIVAQVVKQGQLQAKIYLSGDEIGRIKKGDKTRIVVGEKEYAGEIVSFSLIANNSNGRFEVLIRTTDNLSEQTNKNASIFLNVYLDENADGKFFVPLDALNIGQQKKTVFVVEDGKAVSREVETGIIIGTQIEVKSGLSQGDILAVENNKNLQDGQEVKIQE